ncbi:MAG: hypothetical protein OWQ48_06020 [Desulfurococcus sp.]|nr:hypothetical protein [Desulfurococcus sp.]
MLTRYLPARIKLKATLYYFILTGSHSKPPPASLKAPLITVAACSRAPSYHEEVFSIP